MKSVRYIGGPFELDPKFFSRPALWQPGSDFSEDHMRWTASGRSALAFLLDTQDARLNGGIMAMPDYICWDSIELVLEPRIDVTCFPIKDDLTPDLDRLDAVIASPDIRAVMLVDYFGLSDMTAQIACVRQRRPDVWLVIDAVQAFLQMGEAAQRYAGADAAFSSPRKVLAVPEGGVAISFADSLPVLTGSAGSRAEERAAFYLAAAQLRWGKVTGQLDDAMSDVAEAEYVRLFARHAECTAVTTEPMADMAYQMMRCHDIIAAASIRRSNLSVLRDRLTDVLVDQGLGHCLLAAQSGPALAQPIFVNNQKRDAVRAHMRKHGFFCPIHWALSTDADEQGRAARSLSASLLSLPMDQRYTNGDMNAMVSTLETFLSK